MIFALVVELMMPLKPYIRRLIKVQNMFYMVIFENALIRLIMTRFWQRLDTFPQMCRQVHAWLKAKIIMQDETIFPDKGTPARWHFIAVTSKYSF
jgi:hypothetical protein